MEAIALGFERGRIERCGPGREIKRQLEIVVGRKEESGGAARQHVAAGRGLGGMPEKRQVMIDRFPGRPDRG
ncbi:MAG: hypothetical protein ACREFI_18680 [Stellaceae bacterium]